MDLFTLLVVGNLLMPIEFHSKDACTIAAKFISNDLKVTTYCVSPQSGEIVKFEASYDEPVEPAPSTPTPVPQTGYCLNVNPPRCYP